MDTYPAPPHARPARSWAPVAGPGALALALMLFVGVFALRERDANVGDAEGILYVVPIAVLALRFGLRGGVAGALLSCALIVAWDVHGDRMSVSAYGYLSRGVAFLLLGVLLGVVVDHRRRLQDAITRYYDASPDLLATADLGGRFTRVNPAWERTLGHSAEIMCSRPFIDFVHPDDAMSPSPKPPCWPAVPAPRSDSATATAPPTATTDGCSGIPPPRLVTA